MSGPEGFITCDLCDASIGRDDERIFLPANERRRSLRDLCIECCLEVADASDAIAVVREELK